MEKNTRLRPTIYPHTPKNCLNGGQFLFSVPFCQNKRAEVSKSIHIYAGNDHIESCL